MKLQKLDGLPLRVLRTAPHCVLPSPGVTRGCSTLRAATLREAPEAQCKLLRRLACMYASKLRQARSYVVACLGLNASSLCTALPHVKEAAKPTARVCRLQGSQAWPCPERIAHTLRMPRVCRQGWESDCSVREERLYAA